MNKVLILNHNDKECGVYQFGKRIYDLVSSSPNVKYFHRDAKNSADYRMAIDEVKPDFIIYNYHPDRMPWMVGFDKDAVENRLAKHYFIYHDGSMIKSYDKYMLFGYSDFLSNVPSDKSVLMPRPLYGYTGSLPKNDVINIGSFGFPSPHKNFPKIVKLVNDSFSEAVINLHIPRPYFGDAHGYNLPDIINQCKKENTNKNVGLNITSDFLDDDALLEVLAKNDINVFYYSETAGYTTPKPVVKHVPPKPTASVSYISHNTTHQNYVSHFRYKPRPAPVTSPVAATPPVTPAFIPNSGLSAALDYALSVKRPIAITNISLFRHIASDEILLEKNSIADILGRGVAPLQKYHDKWATDNFRINMDKLFI